MAHRASINRVRGGKKNQNRVKPSQYKGCLGTQLASHAQWNGGRETPLGKDTLFSALIVVFPVNLLTVLSVCTVPCLGDRGSRFQS